MVFEVAVVEDSGVDGVEDLVVGEVEDLEAAAGVGASEEGGEMEEDVDSEVCPFCNVLQIYMLL